MDQPGKVANPARGQLNRENGIPLSPCVPENLVSRDGFSRPVPRQPAHLHPQAESGTVRQLLQHLSASTEVEVFGKTAPEPSHMALQYTTQVLFFHHRKNARTLK